MENTLQIDTQTLDALFSEQKKHFPHHRQQPLAYRLGQLRQLERAVLAYRTRLHEAARLDLGKHPQETDASEVFEVVDEIRLARKNLKRWAKPMPIKTPLLMLGARSWVQYEPHGVCLIISPWNYPFSLAMAPLISALAAGNTAIIKPSEVSPNVSQVMADLIRETFPPEEVAVVLGDAEVSKALLAKPFDHIFFTGSPQIGKVVMEAAAKNLTSVTLELGGKSPVIVDETTNLQDTAEKIAWGKLLNNGQTCVAPDYLLVHRSVADDLLRRMVACVQKMYNGDGKGIEHSESYGRIVSDRHFARVSGLIQEAVMKGAKVAFGGQTLADQRFIAPTFLTEVPEDARVLHEEIFGPVLPIIPYDRLEDALRYTQRFEKPLSFYVFSNNERNIRYLMANSSAGTSMINDVCINFANPELPFGGVNHSGLGKSHGYYGFRAFSNERAVMRQLSFTSGLKVLYPPFHPRIKPLLDFLIKFW